MIRRTPLVAALAVSVVVALAACAPAPAPTPTPVPTFATDAEAFAAAEATYRAYVDALNAVDLSDPATFEPVYAWTTGELNASARKSFSQMHADGWRVSGQSKVRLFEGTSASSNQITAAACLDVSDVAVVDASGTSVVDSNRGDVQSVQLVFEKGDSRDMLISSIVGREGEPQCA